MLLRVLAWEMSTAGTISAKPVKTVKTVKTSRNGRKGGREARRLVVCALLTVPEGPSGQESRALSDHPINLARARARAGARAHTIRHTFVGPYSESESRPWRASLPEPRASRAANGTPGPAVYMLQDSMYTVYPGCLQGAYTHLGAPGTIPREGTLALPPWVWHLLASEAGRPWAYGPGPSGFP